MLIKVINLMVLLGFCFISKAQHTFELNGRVITEKKQAISFCNIIIKGQPTKGVVSDYEGNFSITANINDTLTISYVGYETKYQIVKEPKFINIILKPTVYNLSEVVIKPSKVLTANQVIKQTLKNWKDNNFIYNKGDEFKADIKADFLAKKNQEKIYYFNGITNLYVLNDSLFSNLKDGSFLHQTDTIPSSVFFYQDGRPYGLIYIIFFKLYSNNKYSFELGPIEYYNNQPVYHIKYHRKKGGGMCEGGGYYLISKNDFSLLYSEHITKDCIGLSNETENMVWQYAIFRTFFNKINAQKYQVEKAESEIRFSYKKLNITDEYYYKNNVIVNRIIKESLTKLDKTKIGYAKDVFYKKIISK